VAPPRSCGIFLHYLTEKLKRSPCGPAFRVAEVLAVVVPSLERVILHGNQVITASAEYSPPLVGNYVPLMGRVQLGHCLAGKPHQGRSTRRLRREMVERICGGERKGYCISEAPNAQAVVKSHKLMGYPISDRRRCRGSQRDIARTAGESASSDRRRIVPVTRCDRSPLWVCSARRPSWVERRVVRLPAR
jgi:hypothetical protein